MMFEEFVFGVVCGVTGALSYATCEGVSNFWKRRNK